MCELLKACVEADEQNVAAGETLCGLIERVLPTTSRPRLEHCLGPLRL
jgi:hypothetical protein